MAMNAHELLDAALKQIESESIRFWVLSQRNVWERLGAQPILDKYSENDHGVSVVTRLVCLITVEAIGL